MRSQCNKAHVHFLTYSDRKTESIAVPNDLYFGQMCYSRSVINKWTMKFMIGKELNVLKEVCYSDNSYSYYYFISKYSITACEIKTSR